MSLLPPLTIAEIRRLIAERKAKPSEIIAESFRRIDAHDAEIRSFITLTREAALSLAVAQDARVAGGRYEAEPLAGVPLSLKDIIETAGIRTTAHSRSLADNVPARDALIYQRLSSAGAILVGKAATWEFAHGGPSWDILQPPACNPWDVRRDPSGSSSGSAAGIAAGFVPASVGSDTGGSIRGPAAACGVIGLKPTNGLLPLDGVISNSFSLDCVGPLAWTSEDLAYLMDVMAAPAQRQKYSQSLATSLKGMRIGIPRQWIEVEAPPSQDVQNLFAEAVAIFENQGAIVKPVTLSPLHRYEDTKKIIAAVELYATHGPVLRRTPELLGHAFRTRIAAGAFVAAEDYLNAHRWRSRLIAEMDAVFENVDFLILPTSEPAGELKPNNPEGLFTGLGFHAAFNVTGNPALATRMGFSSAGLPVSMQIVGRRFEDAAVLAAGHQFERVGGWGVHRPPVATQSAPH